MIPKIIHYCWFGGNPKPKLAEKCIKSWKKYCKGYKIIEWNEDSFDISSAPLYVKQAYEAKKWAFVSDYVRLWALVNQGGIYMDTDVEVIRPLDSFLKYEAVSGFESESKIPTGFMACQKSYPLFVELLKEYDNDIFIKEDGSLNIETNVTKITRTCLEHGFIPNGQFQIFDGFAIFPQDYFCPIDGFSGELHKTKNTYTIHHFMASWVSEKDKAELKEKRKKWKKEERKWKREQLIDKFTHFPNRAMKKLLGEEKYNNIKSKTHH